MARVIVIAAAIGFLVPIAWLFAVWSFTLTGHESLISGEWFSDFSVLICPPFFLQFTILAPFLNGAIYAFVAYVALLVVNSNRQQSSGVH